MRKALKVVSAVAVLLAWAGLAHAAIDPEIEARVCGANASIVPDYGWWYGCSPTSAGMAAGYYDINGYGGLLYPNMVAGGVAELSAYPPSAASLGCSAIASSGHVADFYVAGYGASGDDVAPPHHSFDCLADFMGTSQDSCTNSNGSTTFYYYTNGAAFHWSDAEFHGVTNKSGMYGIREYIQYATYDVTDIYNQYINPYHASGFTWAQYCAEIDAGRVVLIHVEGHTMLGYDYTAAGQLVHLYDTWTQSDAHRMAWGGSYSGLLHYGVTVLELTGGDEPGEPDIPEPGTLLLLAGGVCVFLVRRRIAA